MSREPRSVPSAAKRLVERIAILASFSDEPGRLTRTFRSPAMARASRAVGDWMKAAGLEAHEDRWGNVIGRTLGWQAGRRLIIGSHLDTVVDAGRWDGALGVLTGIAAVEALGDEAGRLPFGLEVVGFADEEGVRFQAAYLGSRGLLGRLGPADLERRDARGVALRDLVRDDAPADPAAYARERLAGYLEVHIEQGPALEDRGRSLGVTTGIAGATRAAVTWTGLAGHAGTAPMRLRQDALAGAAAWIVQVEHIAREWPGAGVVATVGSLEVHPGASNVIPGEVRTTLDVRSPEDPVREAAVQAMHAEAMRVAGQRGLGLSWEEVQATAAVAADAGLTQVLAAAVEAVQGEAPALSCGAGHDAVVMASAAPMAMLLVRCRNGLSHHPDEHVEAKDVAAALEATVAFLRKLGKMENGEWRIENGE